MTVVDFALVGDGYRPTNISFGTTVDPADPFGTEVARRMDNVDVSGDGRLAVLSKADAAELLLLEMATQVITPIALPSAPTDVDLDEDGLFALAALRDERQVARVDLADLSAPAVFLTTVSGVVPGQVVIAPEAERAVIFSNAAEFEAIGVLDMVSGDTTVVPLQKSVRAVAITPDGEAAVVIHNKKDGDPDDPRLDPVTDLDEIIDRTFGFSLVRFSDGLVVRQETACDPGAWLVYPDAHKAFLTLRDDDNGVRDVLQADLIDFVTDTVHLGSPPASLGLAPLTRKVFVGQEHATGRITFISADTGSVQTVTGFELNDWIVE
jgi:DNA-binding beta-propeller fold protein YncE